MMKNWVNSKSSVVRNFNLGIPLGVAGRQGTKRTAGLRANACNTKTAIAHSTAPIHTSCKRGLTHRKQKSA
jgi:hypothetical protein